MFAGTKYVKEKQAMNHHHITVDLGVMKNSHEILAEIYYGDSVEGKFS